MRRIVLLSLCVLLVGDAAAQRRAGFVPAVGRGGFRPSLGRGGSGFGRRRMVYPGVGGYGYGYGYLPDDGDESFGYSPQPVFLIQPPPPTPVVETPPAPARPVVNDYKWPVAGTATASARYSAGRADGASRNICVAS